MSLQAGRLALALFVAALLGLFIASQISISYSLADFLPAAQTPAQKLLLQQLEQPAAANLTVLAVRGPDSQAPTEAQLSNVIESLRESGLYSTVRSSLSDIDLAKAWQQLADVRFLLVASDYSVAGLQAAFAGLRDELELLQDPELLEIAARDPYLSLRELFEALPTVGGAATGGQWTTPDGHSLLLAESSAAAFDVAAQQTLYAATSEWFAQQFAAAGLQLELGGMGAISAQMATHIQQEARWRSILASSLLLLLLLVFLRDARLVLLGAVPLLFAALAGLLTLVLGFERVHGITLAFGFTLLGVAIDYPLHLFHHARGRTLQQAARQVWPTIRLGVLSTIAVYLAMAMAGSQGLAQLGVFTASGLLVAALCTRYVVPAMMPGELHATVQQASTAVGRTATLRFWPALLVVGLGLGLAWPLTSERSIWSHDLSDLSPVPASLLKREASYASSIGMPDPRYSLVLEHAELQPLLQASERLSARLRQAQRRLELGAYSSISQVLPSEQRQLQRRASIPHSAELAARLEQAAAAEGMATPAFGAFLEDAERARTQPLLSDSQLLKTPLREFVGSHLEQTANGWRAHVRLYDLRNPAELTAMFSQDPSVIMLDQKAASNELVMQYRSQVIDLLAIAGLLVAVGLIIRLGVRRGLWCLCSVGGALLTTALLLLQFSGPLTIYHLVALLLVLGIGLDYALFRCREEQDVFGRLASARAIMVCALSTMVVFVTLGLSALPALSALGISVSLGAALSYGITRAGSWP